LSYQPTQSRKVAEIDFSRPCWQGFSETPLLRKTLFSRKTLAIQQRLILQSARFPPIASHSDQPWEQFSITRIRAK
jgi:hypothetical protein